MNMIGLFSFRASGLFLALALAACSGGSGGGGNPDTGGTTPQDQDPPGLGGGTGSSCTQPQMLPQFNGLSSCCIDLSEILVKKYPGVDAKDPGNVVIDGRTCPVTILSGFASIQGNLTIKDVKYLVPADLEGSELDSTLENVSGLVTIEGRSEQEPTVITRAGSLVPDIAKTELRSTGDLVLRNVNLEIESVGLRYRVVREAQRLEMENVRIANSSIGMFLEMGRFYDKGLKKVSSDFNKDSDFNRKLTLGAERNFKPVFKNVEIVDAEQPLVTNYPFAAKGLRFVRKDGVFAPSVTLTGPYYGVEGKLSADYPYVVRDGFMLNEGSKLTVEPGAVVKSKASSFIVRSATLVAKGQADKPILFTSFQDDTGGDTNGDGTSGTPKSNDWEGLFIAGRSSVDLGFVTFTYAGVSVSNSDLTISDKVTLKEAPVCLNQFANRLYFNASCVPSGGNLTQSYTSLYIHRGSDVRVAAPLEISWDSSIVDIKKAVAVNADTATEIETPAPRGVTRFAVEARGNLTLNTADPKGKIGVAYSYTCRYSYSRVNDNATGSQLLKSDVYQIDDTFDKAWYSFFGGQDGIDCENVSLTTGWHD